MGNTQSQERPDPIKVFADAVRTYKRPRNTHHVPSIDRRRIRQERILRLFNAPSREDLQDATGDFLNHGNTVDYLACIAGCVDEDEMITRHRFKKRYLDDINWWDADVTQRVRVLSRMFIDEIETAAVQDSVALEWWQEALREEDERDPEEPSELPVVIEDIIRDRAFDGWLRVFRATHGDRDGWRDDINAFFHINPVTRREETYATFSIAPDRLAFPAALWVKGARKLEPTDTPPQTAEWHERHVRNRISHPHALDSKRDLTEKESLDSIEHISGVEIFVPGQDASFSWGRLYLRLLRHIELFGVEELLRVYKNIIPSGILRSIERRGHAGGKAVLRMGYMRTGEACLAALLADWLGDFRASSLPRFLKGAPQLDRRPRSAGRLGDSDDQPQEGNDSDMDEDDDAVPPPPNNSPQPSPDCQQRCEAANARVQELEAHVSALELHLAAATDRADDLDAQLTVEQVEHALAVEQRDEYREKLEDCEKRSGREDRDRKARSPENSNDDDNDSEENSGQRGPGPLPRGGGPVWGVRRRGGPSQDDLDSDFEESLLPPPETYRKTPNTKRKRSSSEETSRSPGEGATRGSKKLKTSSKESVARSRSRSSSDWILRRLRSLSSHPSNGRSNTRSSGAMGEDLTPARTRRVLDRVEILVPRRSAQFETQTAQSETQTTQSETQKTTESGTRRTTRSMSKKKDGGSR